VLWRWVNASLDQKRQLARRAWRAARRYVEDHLADCHPYDEEIGTGPHADSAESSAGNEQIAEKVCNGVLRPGPALQQLLREAITERAYRCQWLERAGAPRPDEEDDPADHQIAKDGMAFVVGKKGLQPDPTATYRPHYRECGSAPRDELLQFVNQRAALETGLGSSYWVSDQPEESVPGLAQIVWANAAPHEWEDEQLVRSRTAACTSVGAANVILVNRFRAMAQGRH